MDLRDYALGEGTAAEREAMAARLAASAEEREELRRWELTLRAVADLLQEEIPRRIAFVSDPVWEQKVMEPKWWQRLWPAGPQWGFASAAVLAMAILAHGWVIRPVEKTMVVEAPAASRGGEQELDVQAIVREAVAASEERQQREFRKVLAEVQQEHESEIRLMAASMEENQSLLRKQMNRLYMMSANLAGPSPEGVDAR
ncbi:MAG: hypothetical protein NW208_10385 [Bryobacter sp.]|nr:hypothetical protein [Bryobacter sp.]